MFNRIEGGGVLLIRLSRLTLTAPNISRMRLPIAPLFGPPNQQRPSSIELMRATRHVTAKDVREFSHRQNASRKFIADRGRSGDDDDAAQRHVDRPDHLPDRLEVCGML